MVNWEQIEARIPEYEVFLTVDELNSRTKQLSRRYPDVVEQSVIGRSRLGEPIYCLKIGEGRKRVVWFGCPHPNEPIGTLTIDFWAELLAKDDALREELDCTFFLVKCIDPDGTRLNEGWFKGPFDIYTYASNFYRPAGKDQVEWTFPIEYKTLKFDSPLPETQALMELIDTAKPHFLYALHNAGFGGAYFYINRQVPSLYPELHRAIENLGIPLSQGEPEVPWAKTFAKAVYELTKSTDAYDYYAQFAPGDPAQMVMAGASSSEYAAKYNTLCLVSELPYFYHPSIDDASPTDRMRTEVLSSSLEMQQEMVGFLAPRHEQIRACQGSPFAAALQEFLGKTPQRLQAQRAWIETLKADDRPATTAEAFDSLVVMRFYVMLYYGMLARHCRWCADQDPARQGEYLQLAEEIDGELLRTAERLEAEYPYQVIPIRKLVSAQLASGLYTLPHL
ncbi:MAG: hypothetical protein GX341_00865 [Firmicutes bacterium]|nr:hypothetical protein [Bacillota bacterium]